MKRYVFLWLWLLPAVVRAQSGGPTPLTDAERLYGLSTFWSEAKYNFAYFDKARIDWDSAYKAFIPQVVATRTTADYYRTMERFCALLKDGHTNVYAPSSLVSYSTYRPLQFQVIDQKLYVSHVLKGLSDNVPVGSEVLTVNGIPTNQYLAEQVFPYVSASAEHQRWNTAATKLWSAAADTTTMLPLTLRTPSGKVMTYASRLFSQRERDGSMWLKGGGSVANLRPPLSTLTMLPGDLARIELNSFGDDKIISEFKAMLPELRKAKGIIIDLRQNGGGSTNTGTAILNYFTEQKLMTGSAWRTREHWAANKAWGTWAAKQPIDSMQWKNSSEYRKNLLIVRGDYWYKAEPNQQYNTVTEPKLLVPTVILAGNNTGSAAEDFLIYVKQLTNRNMPIIGQPSYGSTGQPLPISLPGGGSGRICTKRDTYANGTDFVGIGVLPDIEVNPTPADLISGRDPALERATTYLNNHLQRDNKKVMPPSPALPKGGGGP